MIISSTEYDVDTPHVPGEGRDIVYDVKIPHAHFVVYLLDGDDIDDLDEVESVKSFKSLQPAVSFAKKQNYHTHIVLVPDSDKYDHDMYDYGYDPYEVVWESFS